MVRNANTRIGIYADNEPVLQVVPDPQEFESETSSLPSQETEQDDIPELLPEPESITEPEVTQSRSQQQVQEQLSLSDLPADPPVPEDDKQILYRIVRDSRRDIGLCVRAFANPSTSRDLIENSIAINETAIAFLVDQNRVRAIEFNIAKTLILAKVNAALNNALNCYDSEKTVGDALGYISNAFKLMEKL